MSENLNPNNGSADAPRFTPAQPPQGAPVPPPMQGYQPKPSAALAITALVLGILGVLGSWVPLLGILGGVLALIGLIVGIVALIKVKRGTAGGKGIAIVGVMLNVLAIIVVTIVTIVLITWYGKIQHCVDTSEKDSNGTVICHVDGQNFSVNTRGGIVVHKIP
ncbi:DUF4190 domain-containing protein [Rothia aeria]|uniref:DUF4190 domain-containing protein n=1 Tax=Rothia aeria TaxID=172042 RepID=UPI0028E98A7B|nr:DUF4190 domain-containing protein [Rothia aeria]